MVSRSVEGRLFSKIVKKEAIATAIKVEVGLKKAISFAEMKVKKIRIAAYLSEDATVNAQISKRNQLESEPEVEVTAGTDNIEESKPYAQEPVLTSINSEFGKSTEALNGIGSEELSMECLTCANLVNCDFRNRLSARSEASNQNMVPCNRANHRDLRIKKQVTQ